MTLSCDVKTGGIYEMGDDLRVGDGSTFETVHYTKRSTVRGPKGDACEVTGEVATASLGPIATSQGDFCVFSP